jgi:hypothetical protein
MTETNTDQTSSCSTENKFTTVKTIYARAAVVLLAFNFCLTGYVVKNMNQLTQGQIDDISSQSTPATPATQANSSGRVRTLENQEEPQVGTRESETTKK